MNRLSKDDLAQMALEILRDWDAVVAFVYHPGLPPTNNEAERVIFPPRFKNAGLPDFQIYLGVIETCRLRKVDPWS